MVSEPRSSGPSRSVSLASDSGSAGVLPRDLPAFAGLRIGEPVEFGASQAKSFGKVFRGHDGRDRPGRRLPRSGAHHGRRPAPPLHREFGPFADAAEATIVVNEPGDPRGPRTRPRIEGGQQPASQGAEPSRTSAERLFTSGDEAVEVPDAFDERLGKSSYDEIGILGG